VEEAVIVELKSVRRVVRAQETQLVNYLVAAKIDVGLVLNIGKLKVDLKRKVRTLS
jgi:GxxExxY protein